MKHLKKQTLILLSIASLLLVGLAVFSHIHKKEEKPSYSNLNSKASLNEVRSILSKHLNEESVDNFINLVRDSMIPWVLLDFLGILRHLPKQTMMWKKSVACGRPSMVTLSALTVVSTPTRY